MHKAMRVRATMLRLRHSNPGVKINSKSVVVETEAVRPVTPPVAQNENRVVPDTTDPLPTAGVRVPTVKKAKTARGSSVFKNRIVHHESELEYRVSKCIQARSDVSTLVSQFPYIEYLDEDGVIRHHTSDFMTTFTDGTKVAVAVKVSRKRTEMTKLIALIKATGTVVDENGHKVRLLDYLWDIVLLTEEWATLDAFENACFVLWAVNHTSLSACPDTVEHAMSYRGTNVRLGSLVAGMPNEGTARITVGRLIHQGVLVPLDNLRITDETWLRVTATSGA